MNALVHLPSGSEFIRQTASALPESFPRSNWQLVASGEAKPLLDVVARHSPIRLHIFRIQQCSSAIERCGKNRILIFRFRPCVVRLENEPVTQPSPHLQFQCVVEPVGRAVERFRGRKRGVPSRIALVIVQSSVGEA